MMYSISEVSLGERMKILYIHYPSNLYHGLTAYSTSKTSQDQICAYVPWCQMTRGTGEGRFIKYPSPVK